MAKPGTARQDRIEQLLAGTEEARKRAMEPLHVYRPAAQQQPIHVSKAKEVIIRGGKRSGKTTASILEFASRITGTQIMGPGGQLIPLRYPTPKAEDPRLYWVIGFDVDHIGQTLYPKLFEPGLLRVILDVATGQWRVFNEADPADAGRFAESKPAPAVIPPRLIDQDSWAWEDKRAKVFKSVRLHNGAMICAYPSTSTHAKQGDAVDGILVDEDIADPDFLDEWQDRLISRNGWFMWSVWPHVANQALIDTLDRAEEHQGETDPPIEAFQLATDNNPYSSEEGRRLSKLRRRDNDDIARRDFGELGLESLAMYDFAPGAHTVSKTKGLIKPTSAKEALALALYRNTRFPRDWTRYLAIDPSHTRTAVLIGVVPPPEYEGVEMGRRLIIENELVAKKYNAEQLAKALEPLMGSFPFQAFIMDMHAGRQTWAGQDKSVCEHYALAFRKAGLVSASSGASFLTGCDDKQFRQRCVRSLLDPAEDGLPRLYFIAEKTSETQREFRTYRKKQQRIQGESKTSRANILDEPANPRKHDCMAALEYLCAYVEPLLNRDEAYVAPEIRTTTGSGAFRAAMAMLNAAEKQSTAGYVHLGPGVAA